MFPRPIATHRGTIGTLTGSISSLTESYTGNFTNPATGLVYTNNDPADVQEWEFFDGSTWVSSSLAAINSTNYSTGKQVRTRLVNNYFGVTGSYITSPASSFEDTGGASALQGTYPVFATGITGFSISSPLAGSRTVTFNLGIDTTAFPNTRNIFGKQTRVSITWQGLTGPGGTNTEVRNQVTTGNIWVPATSISDGGLSLNNPGGNPANVGFTLTLTLPDQFGFLINITVTLAALYPDSTGGSTEAVATISQNF